MKLRNSEVHRPRTCSKCTFETYNDFAENTSIHGLKYTVKQTIGRYEKLFWILIVLCGLCGSGYMTILFWGRYTSNPTRTTVLTSYAPTTSIPFPAVTVCNVNKIMVSKVEAFIDELELNGTEESLIRHAFPQLLSLTHLNVVDYNMTELHILQDVLEANGYNDITTVMEKVSQTCEEMLLNCVWNKKTVPCRDIFKKSISYSGICCSFNYELEGLDNFYNPFSGLGTGLRVLLYPMLQSVQYSPFLFSGFKIHIHSSTEYLGPQSDPKTLQIGRISYQQIVGTKMTCSESVKNLPVAKRQCLYPDEFRLKYFGTQYSDSNCLIECEIAIYFRQCECVPFYYTFTDKPICNISKIPCLHEVKSKQMVSKQIQSCNCLPQCENIFYNILSTSTSMEYTKSMSMMSFGDVEITEDMALLNVYFLGNRHTILLKDTITSTIYLLSSFGGVYSLFMGCSLITIAEILYYFFFRYACGKNAFGNGGPDVSNEGRNKRRNRRKIQKVNTISTYSKTHPQQLQQFHYNSVFLP